MGTRIRRLNTARFAIPHAFPAVDVVSLVILASSENDRLAENASAVDAIVSRIDDRPTFVAGAVEDHAVGRRTAVLAATVHVIVHGVPRTIVGPEGALRADVITRAVFRIRKHAIGRTDERGWIAAR